MTRSACILLLFVTSCGESLAPGQCRTNADCANTERCVGATADVVGTCATQASDCEETCGAGFSCRRSGDGRVSGCDLPAGSGFGLVVESPAPAAVVGSGEVVFRCVNAGLAIERGRFELRGPGGPPAVIEATLDDGVLTASWNPAVGGVASGAWVVECEGEKGPRGLAAKQRSMPVAFVVDVESPSIDAVEEPRRWFGPSDVVSIRVDASDPGGGGLASAHLLDGELERATASFEDGTATIEAPVTDLLDGAFEGPKYFRVVARDAAGNASPERGLLLDLDNVAPVVTVAAPSSWVNVVTGVSVSITSSGAPMAEDGVVVEAVAEPSVRFAGIGSGHGTAVSVDPARLVAPDSTGTWALRAVVTDAAGNTGTGEPFLLHVDLAGPAVTIDSAAEFTRVGDTAALRFTLDDAGAGLDPLSVQVTSRGNFVACTKRAESSWSCDFPTRNEPAAATWLPARVSARDLIGNVREVDTGVKLDALGPAGSVVPDARYYSPASDVTVEVDFVDAGVGLDPSRPPTLQFPYAAAPLTGTHAGGSRFVFGPAKGLDLFGNVGEVLDPALTGTATATDLLGNVGTVPVVRRYDGKPPAATVEQLIWPETPIAPQKLLRRESIRRANFVRRDRLGIRVRFEDTFTTIEGTPTSSGLDDAGAFLEYERKGGGLAHVPGRSLGSFRYEFTFDADDVRGPQLGGTEEWVATLRALIVDRAGNAGGVPVNVTVTRVARARRLIGTLLPAGGTGQGPELAYIGVLGAGPTTNNVQRVQLEDGASAGGIRVPGIPFGSPVVGDDMVWVLSRDGGLVVVSGMRPGGMFVPTALEFTCPLPVANVGLPALTSLDWGDGTPSSTLVIAGDDGRLRAIRRDGSGCEVVEDDAFDAYGLDGSQVAIAGSTLTVTLDGGALGLATLAMGEDSFLQHVHAGPAAAGGLPVAGGFALSPSLVAYFSGATPYLFDPALVQHTMPVGNATHPVPTLQPVFATDTRVRFAAGHELRWVDASGAQGLTRSLGGTGYTIDITTTPLVTDSPDGPVMYYGLSDGWLTAVGSNGMSLWGLYVGARLSHTPKLDCRGFLHFVADDAMVYVLATDSSPVAASPWPTWQHDARNTANLGTPNDTCAP